MARTTEQIFDSMVAEGLAQATQMSNADMVAMFSNTSKVAIWRLLFYVVAFTIMVFEQLLDAFKINVDAKVDTMRAHGRSWYVEKAKAFQWTYSLLPDSDQFDSTSSSVSLSESLVVAFAACSETTIDNVRVLLIKVAALSGSSLVPLSDEQFTAFQAYMQTIKDAGVPLHFYNRAADLVRATVNVYYNPMLLDNNGLKTNGGGHPLQDSANNYLLTMGFDGQFINAAFIDALQDSYGVSRRKVDLLGVQRKDVDGVWQTVTSSFIPDSGYCVFDTDGLNITYIADV